MDLMHRFISLQLHSTASEPGVVAFKNETLQFKITLNMVTLQSVHLKVSPSPGKIL